MTERTLRTRSATEKYSIICGRGAIERMLPCRFIVTDSNVFAYYRALLERYGVPLHILPAGEEHKEMAELTRLLAAMAAAGLRRGDRIACVGGGVVGDMGGLAAALYMRGIGCVQVPTTLLAQVDASIGGKTAIDFNGVKNLVGAFYQPEQVIADSAFLETLPPQEIRSGLGEMIKHAALHGELFEALSAHTGALDDLSFLQTVIPANIAFKAAIVAHDPRERGARRRLNLGHTTGHALELSLNSLSHGECVLIGMLFESALARRHVACDEGYLARLDALIRRVLPVLPALPDMREAAQRALFDKKNTEADQVTLIVPVRRGTCATLLLRFCDYVRELEEVRSALC